MPPSIGIDGSEPAAQSSGERRNRGDKHGAHGCNELMKTVLNPVSGTGRDLTSREHEVPFHFLAAIRAKMRWKAAWS